MFGILGLAQTPAHVVGVGKLADKVGCAFWDLKGQTGFFAKATYEADIQKQRATLGHFGSPGRRVRFSPDLLVLEGEDGKIIDVRNTPRSAFAAHVAETLWDQLHAAYFDGYALWTYLTQPFLYTYPGFVTDEIEPWEEDGEVWRRFRIIFPDEIASHTREQMSYFGPDGLLHRRLYECRLIDVVTIHLILSDRTRGLFGSADLALMKPTAWLIKTSSAAPPMARNLNRGRARALSTLSESEGIP
jgi:D-isomer specific 2-hydroxyacid dehydrogenase, NAD binding domain